MVRSGRADEALTLLDADADDAPTLAGRAVALEALGRLDEAVAAADRAIEVADQRQRMLLASC